MPHEVKTSIVIFFKNGVKKSTTITWANIVDLIENGNQVFRAGVFLTLDQARNKLADLQSQHDVTPPPPPPPPPDETDPKPTWITISPANWEIKNDIIEGDALYLTTTAFHPSWYDRDISAILQVTDALGQTLVLKEQPMRFFENAPDNLIHFKEGVGQNNKVKVTLKVWASITDARAFSKAFNFFVEGPLPPPPPPPRSVQCECKGIITQHPPGFICPECGLPPPPMCDPGFHLEDGVCVPDDDVPPPPPPPDEIIKGLTPAGVVVGLSLLYLALGGKNKKK